jgi:hypothetical protein
MESVQHVITNIEYSTNDGGKTCEPSCVFITLYGHKIKEFFEQKIVSHPDVYAIDDPTSECAKLPGEEVFLKTVLGELDEFERNPNTPLECIINNGYVMIDSENILQADNPYLFSIANTVIGIVGCEVCINFTTEGNPEEVKSSDPYFRPIFFSVNNIADQ